MKRCPQCGREYDNSMSFCLDDGAELLYGPAVLSEPGADATGEFLEPATAILSAGGMPPSGGASHRDEATQILGSETHEIERLDRGIQSESEPTSQSAHSAASSGGRVGFDKRLFAAPLLFAVMILGVFFGYRYFASTNQIESIAVMPFVNGSGNSDVEYLSDGMTETLIRSLSQLPNLNVKSRSSVFRYKGKDTDAKTIARELGVQAILNGRVVQSSEGVSLTLELIDAASDNVLWAEKYDRRSSDLVALQNEIARDVSTKLRLKLSGADEQKLAKRYTTDSDAYRLYLQGRFYWNKRAGRDFEKSVAYFRQAIEKDPSFALGYVGLADYYGDKEREKAKENVNRALALDDNLAEAHGTLGYQYMLDYDWTAAERHMKRALDLDPKNNVELYRWNGQRLMMLGRYDEALEAYRRALEIDPNSSPVHFIYGSCLVASGQLDKGIEYLENTIKADPSFVWSHSQLSFAYRFKNNYERAVEERAVAQELLGEMENAKLTRESFAKGGRDGYLREMIRQGVNPDGITGGMRTASAHAILGEYDKALDTLELGATKGEFWLFQIKFDPAYEPIRGNPRFQALLKKFDASS